MGLGCETGRASSVVSPRSVVVIREIREKLNAATYRFHKHVVLDAKCCIWKASVKEMVLATCQTYAFPINDDISKCSVCFSLTKGHCSGAENILCCHQRCSFRVTELLNAEQEISVFSSLWSMKACLMNTFVRIYISWTCPSYTSAQVSMPASAALISDLGLDTFSSKKYNLQRQLETGGHVGVRVYYVTSINFYMWIIKHMPDKWYLAEKGSAHCVPIEPERCCCVALTSNNTGTRKEETMQERGQCET